MGFLDFLLQVGKVGVGFVGGIVMTMAGFVGMSGGISTIIAGVMIIIGFVGILYSAYSMRQLDRNQY